MTGKQKVNGVPVFNQYPELPTGCEATALAMLLNWGGVTVSKYDVVNALPKGEKVRLVDGVWLGANPEVEFVGDPYSDDDFGVFEKPILQTVEKLASSCKGINLTGHAFESILDVIRAGKAVMAWTTIDQKPTYLSKKWMDENGKIIDWYCNEHALVITGFNKDNVIVHDPYTGKEEYYQRDLFERNWEAMGKRAITLAIKSQ